MAFAERARVTAGSIWKSLAPIKKELLFSLLSSNLHRHYSRGSGVKVRRSRKNEASSSLGTCKPHLETQKRDCIQSFSNMGRKLKSDDSGSSRKPSLPAKVKRLLSSSEKTRNCA